MWKAFKSISQESFEPAEHDTKHVLHVNALDARHPSAQTELFYELLLSESWDVYLCSKGLNSWSVELELYT